MAPRGTTIRNIRIDGDLWQRFGQVAELDGTTRSELVRKLMSEHIARRLAQSDPGVDQVKPISSANTSDGT